MLAFDHTSFQVLSLYLRCVAQNLIPLPSIILRSYDLAPSYIVHRYADVSCVVYHHVRRYQQNAGRDFRARNV